MNYHSYESIEKSARLLDSILAGSTEYAIIATDNNDHVVVWNSGAEQILGYTAEEMIGSPSPIDLKEQNFIRNNLLFMERNVMDSSVFDYQTNIETKYGTTIPVSVTITVREDLDEHPLGFLIIIKEITKEMLQEKFRDIIIEISHIVNLYKDLNKMLNEILFRIRNFLDIPIAYICLYDDKNKKFSICSYSGLEDISGHHCFIGDPDNNSCYETFSQLVINSEQIEDHPIFSSIPGSSYKNEDMTIFHIPLLSDVSVLGMFHVVIPTSLKSLYLEDTQILSLIANAISAGIQRRKLEQELQIYADNLEKMVQNRTEQLRQKDSQLVQSGKLATLGEMATGIAHEINQPLGSISLTVQGLIRAYNMNKLNGDILKDKLGSILNQITRIEKIISHLRTFGRQAPEAKFKVNINKPLLDVLDLIGQQLKDRNITVDLDLNDNLPYILADNNKLEQVFLNIVGNARDTLDEREQINTIAAKDGKEIDWKKKIHICTYSKNDIVYIKFTDTGCGIPSDIMDKVFEPFFTTKQVGEGTGLGLSISYGIIKEFNGIIDIKSQVGSGTNFVISFPAIEQNN